MGNKNWVLFLLVAQSYVAAQALNISQAPVRPHFEAGIMIGVPSGLSVKYWFTDYTAVDGVAGWSFPSNQGHFSVDYQYHFRTIAFERGYMPLLFGLGAGLKIGDDTYFGARIPLGAEYIFQGPWLTLFGEITPVMRLIPDIRYGVEGGAGIRFILF